MANAELFINNRYKIRDAPIGQGGTGVVYRAFDAVTNRDVAVKMLTGIGPSGLESLREQWTVLAQLSHPNISILSTFGEFEASGEKRPYLVMPLLRGVTLDHLIRASSPRLTVGRVIEVISRPVKVFRPRTIWGFNSSSRGAPSLLFDGSVLNRTKLTGDCLLSRFLQ